MGNFYTNIAVHGAPLERISELIRALNRKAYVASVGNGWSVVYDQQSDTQDTAVLSALADHLASETDGMAFAVLNHDDDILWFQFFRGKDLISEYATSGGPKTQVAALCSALGHRAATPVVWFILHVPFLFEIWRHRLLAKKLGLPLATVGFGFEYISRGETPEGLSRDQLIELSLWRIGCSISDKEAHMKISWFTIYNLVLALWVGGISIFSFIVAPMIFKSYGLDTASGIVGHIFPGYFLYNLVLAAMALALFFLLPIDRAALSSRFSLVLLALALIVNIFIVFKLHPDAVAAKQQVASFESEPADSPARKKFSRLHALSASLNLLLLLDGIALLIATPAAKK